MITIKEFAYTINVHRHTVRKMIKEGRISYIRTGTGKKAGYRIPASEIERMAIVEMENFKIK